MLMPQFTLEYWRDADWYVGRLVEIPGVNSQGATLDELEENIADAYREVIAAREALSRRGRRPARRKRVQLSV
jgi:predicted RNase H-like HicB family nuclease